jgi:hypothetical protein
MSRVRLASDMCDIYYTCIKVNHLFYTCSLDYFEDGILLDTPLTCMHRYYRSFIADEEECKRKCTPTPSTREAWKRHGKKGEEDRAAAWHEAGHPNNRSNHRASIGRPGPIPNHPATVTGGTRRLALNPDHSGLRPDHPGAHPDHSALPVCMTGHLALYPHLTYPFALSTIYRPPLPHL